MEKIEGENNIPLLDKSFCIEPNCSQSMYLIINKATPGLTVSTWMRYYQAKITFQAA
jgi:hypothetical protein